MSEPTVTERLDAIEAELATFALPRTMATLQRKLETTWQPEASVLLGPSSVTPEMLTIRSVRGVVTSAGAVSYGAGFTVVRNAAGDYTITITSPFSAAPVVTLGLGVGAGANAIKLKNGSTVTADSFSVYTYVAGGALTDSDFHFNATDRS